MTLQVILGEPLWRESSAHKITVDLAPGETLPLAGLPARIGLSGWTAEDLLVVVNDRVITAREAGALRVGDGDTVVLQLMLAGG
jgi:hypothetical protein